jgi:Na+/proline symporter
VALQLSLVLTAVLVLVALLLANELDLLALVILSTYASVFIALALLALHFGPFWLRASSPDQRGGFVARVLPLALAGLTCWWVGVYIPAAYCTTSGAVGLGVLWQDLALDTRVRVGGYVGLTH